MMEDCIFCSITAGRREAHRVVWRTSDFVAFLDLKPIVEGHVLVVPIRHEKYLFDLNQDAYRDLMNAVHNVADQMKKVFNVERVAMAVSGTEIPHVHVHLLPGVEGAEIFQPIRLPALTEESAAVLRGRFRDAADDMI